MPQSHIIIFLLFSLLGDGGKQVLSFSGSEMGAGVSLSIFFCHLAAGTPGFEVLNEGAMPLQQGGQDQLFPLVGRMAKTQLQLWHMHTEDW